jgi:hypothetical protein
VGSSLDRRALLQRQVDCRVDFVTSLCDFYPDHDPDLRNGKLTRIEKLDEKPVRPVPNIGMSP